MSKKLYNIVMNPGVPETDLLENEARDMELKLNPDLFDGIIVLILNEEEADIIRASGKVQFCEPEPEVFEHSYPAVTPKYEIPSNSTTQYLTRYITSVPLSNNGASYTSMNMYFNSEFECDTDYRKGELVTDSYVGAVFDRSLTVNGIKLVVAGAVGGQTAVPDEWAKKTARVIDLMMDSSDSGVNKAYQRKLIQTLAGVIGPHKGRPTIQRIAYGGGASYSPNFLTDSGAAQYAGYNELLNKTVHNDMVWYKNTSGPDPSTSDRDIEEIMEHLFHTIHNFGIPGAVPNSETECPMETLAYILEENPSFAWQSTDLHLAMKEAIDAGLYDPSGYSTNWNTDPEDAVVAYKEYTYLVNWSMWEMSQFWDGGSLSPEWDDALKTMSGMAANNPLGYALFNTYFDPVLSKPNFSTLQNIFQDNDAGVSGYTANDTTLGNGSGTPPIGYFGDYTFAESVKSNFMGDYVDIIAIEAGTPVAGNAGHEDHPDFEEFDTNNSKFIPMDWSTVSSGMNDPRNNQVSNNNTNWFSSHCIGVLSAAGGKYCGWAKKSNLRVMYLSDGTTTAYYTALTWHTTKPVNPITGVRNATVVIGSWGISAGFDSYYRCDQIQSLNVYDKDTGLNTVINRPGSDWGNDLTPFTDNNIIPRVIEDPGNNTKYWCVPIPAQTRESYFDTIMGQYNNYNGIYHFKAAGNSVRVYVDPEDPRFNTQVTVGIGANGIINTLDSNGVNQFSTNVTSNTTTYYPLRAGLEGGANQLTITACQHDDTNRLLDDYSARGPAIDLAAEGAYTWTSYPTTTFQDGKWGYFSGTSAAAPVAAGAAAIFIDWYFTQRGVYPSIAQLKKLMQDHAKADLISENLIDFSNPPTPADFPSTKLYSSSDVFSIKTGQYGNGGADLSDLAGTEPLRVNIPWGIRMGSGKYIAGGTEQTKYGRRPTTGRAWPRPKVSFSS